MEDANQPAEPGSELSVVDRVITAFTKAVAEQDGLAEVASRLSETLIVKKDLSEAAILRALFEGNQA
jgi:hypothetical protein